jgi:ribosomal protein RSM22 (predicted rRNA methylase)
MPATYAAVRASLEALSARAPEFAPTSLLDVGCGSGGASLAAVETYPELGQVRLVDQNAPLLDIAAKLLPRAEQRLGGLGAAELRGADLVIAAYVLTELAEPDLAPLIERLWAATTGALVLVEPGTPAAWARLMAIRARLVDLGAVVAAPCPHQEACPIVAPDWCHFSQRLPRSRAHRLLKSADAPFEDEKYAYGVFTRPHIALETPRPRVVGPTFEDKGALSLKLCQPDGTVQLRRIGKRDKNAYRAVRRLQWGDRVGG